MESDASSRSPAPWAGRGPLHQFSAAIEGGIGEQLQLAFPLVIPMVRHIFGVSSLRATRLNRKNRSWILVENIEGE